MNTRRSWASLVFESASVAANAIFAQPLRSALAVVGVVIGIVTVVVVTAVLTGLRNQVALLFREFGSENIFAYHRTGDPYSPARGVEINRKPLDPALAKPLGELGAHIRDVGVQLIVPTVVSGRPLVAKGAGREVDTVLAEGVSSNYFDVTSAELAAGRVFTDLEERAGAKVAVVGANTAAALWGRGQTVGKTMQLGNESFTIIGEAAPRKGGFFGENRQDNVVAIPLGTARKLFPQAESTVFYIRAEPGQRDLAKAEAEAVLRRLRRLDPRQPNDFNLSTADQIIAQFDRLSATIGLVTVALAFLSLVIGGIGIANVMIISVTERTREIGIRRAVGARREEVLRQFLYEASFLAFSGGVVGVAMAALIGLSLSLALPGFPAIPAVPVVLAGLVASMATGIVAGYFPARRAAGLDPVESLRYE